MCDKKANPVDVHVGARMKSRRLMLGLTQQELAAKIGVTFQQLQKYEKGINRVGASRIQMVAKGLGVTPAFFFEDPLTEMISSSAKGEANEISEFLQSKDGVELNTAFGSISSHSVRRSILSLVKAIGASSAKSDPLVE